MMAWLMGLETISPADLQRQIEQKQVTVIDVNAPLSWAKARVPGARNLDPASFESKDLPADPQASLVFYCSNPLCRKAPSAARRAKSMGYGNVKVLSAGISGWLSAGLPAESGEVVG